MAVNCERILLFICFRSLVGCSAYFNCDCNNNPWRPIINRKFDHSFDFPHYDVNAGLSHYSTYKHEDKLFDNIYNMQHKSPYTTYFGKMNLKKPKEEIKEVKEILDEPILDKTLFFMPLLPQNVKQDKMIEKEKSDVKKTTEVKLETMNNGSKMKNENAYKVMDTFFKIDNKKIEEMVESNKKEMPMKKQEQKKEDNKVFVDIGKEFMMPIFPETDFKSHHNQKYDSDSEEVTDNHHDDKNVYYLFEYSVNDKTTKDIKHQKEERKGDKVMGEYSLQEEGGNVRTVKYVADWKSGFHAQVHNSKKS